jgi:hypothetical protein
MLQAIAATKVSIPENPELQTQKQNWASRALCILQLKKNSDSLEILPTTQSILERKGGGRGGLQRKTESLYEMKKWEKEKYACVQLTDLLLSLPPLQPFLPAATSSPTIHKNSDLDLLSCVCVCLSILFIRATRQQQQQPRKKKKDSSLAYAGRGLHNVSVHTWTKRTPRCKINYPHSHFWPKPNSLLGSLKTQNWVSNGNTPGLSPNQGTMSFHFWRVKVK